MYPMMRSPKTIAEKSSEVDRLRSEIKILGIWKHSKHYNQHKDMLIKRINIMKDEILSDMADVEKLNEMFEK